MVNEKPRILMVENDPEIRVQIAYKSLIPSGYIVSVAHTVNDAINEMKESQPDVILANINMPGLNARDLLVATSSQGVQASFIVVARKGQENDILQSFRMGADDYIIWPARDTEIVAVVERCLQKSRKGQVSDVEKKKYREAIQDSKKDNLDLKKLLTFSKAILSVIDRKELLNRTLEAALHFCNSDMGWIYCYDSNYGTFRLDAERHLPELWKKKLGNTMDDGISTLVAMSGESLAVNGVPLKRFKVANLGQSAAVIPIKINEKVRALIVLIRTENTQFEKREIKMADALAELAALALSRMPDSSPCSEVSSKSAKEGLLKG